MSKIVTYEESQTLETETCYKCAVLFAMPARLKQQRRNDKQSFFCPNGHSQAYIGDTEADRLRREVQSLRQQEARHEQEKQVLQEKVRLTEYSRLKTEKALKRVEKRVHAGVCPDCNRTFDNVARHMKTKHTDVKCDAPKLVATK